MLHLNYNVWVMMCEKIVNYTLSKGHEGNCSDYQAKQHLQKELSHAMGTTVLLYPFTKSTSKFNPKDVTLSESNLTESVKAVHKRYLLLKQGATQDANCLDHVMSIE